MSGGRVEGLLDGLFDGLCDDAAVFPPGSLPLAEAVPAHLAHRHADHAAIVGSFVVAATDLPALAERTAGLPAGALGVSVTVPAPGVASALAAAAAIPAVRLTAVEVALPVGFAPADLVRVAAEVPESVEVYVELPRDHRRTETLAALVRTTYRAKLRTGGVRAEMYPDERELAEAIRLLVCVGVAFKATAGLHHAVRNTDPVTGFEQHGFLNVLAATAAARRGADRDALAAMLARRDGARLAELVAGLDPMVRDDFVSFGTCSIREPADELAGLGLLPAGRRASVSV